MAARKEFPVKVRRVAVTNKKTGVKYIEERRYQYDPKRALSGSVMADLQTYQACLYPTLL